MNARYDSLIQSKMDADSYRKLSALNNPKVMEFVGQFIEHCRPDSVFVCTDSEEDIQHVRDKALQAGEETRLAKSGQTIHWDGYGDQGRDKHNTRILVAGENLARMGSLNAIDVEEGEKEILEISAGIMEGKEAIVQFFSEGPTESPFTIPCVQFTDSWYVAHSEFILYRSAYHHFLTWKTAKSTIFSALSTPPDGWMSAATPSTWTSGASTWTRRTTSCIP